MSIAIDKGNLEVYIKIKATVHQEFITIIYKYQLSSGGYLGRDRMVVGYITTYAISAYHH